MRHTGLVAKDCVQNVASIATAEEEQVGRCCPGGLVTEEGDSRSVPDGIEVARVKGVNRSQHSRF